MRAMWRDVMLPTMAGMLVIGCGGSENSPMEPLVRGAIQVVIDATGEDITIAGISVSLTNNPVAQFSSDTAQLTLLGLVPGVYTVALDGLRPNCQIASPNPRQVTVVKGQTAIAGFQVACAPLVGSIRLTTVTTGGDLDGDGYTANVIGVATHDVPVSGTATIPNLRQGGRLITLAGVAPNCLIAGPDTLAVTITYGSTTDLTFSVECRLTGSLRVTIATTGVDLDLDGYVVAVEGPAVPFSSTFPAAHTETRVLSGLLPASNYRVSLQNIAANCDVVGEFNRTVAVVEGATTDVTFNVTCTPPPLLVVTRDGDIFAIRSNGAGVARVTNDPANDDLPVWSSTGKIAFTTNRHSNDAELYVVDDNGANPRRLTISAGIDDSPSWSPDGQRIVFRSSRDVNSEIYIVNVDGTGLTRLTTNGAYDTEPAWSSTGKIAFVSDRDHPEGELYVMNPDGSNVVRLTFNTVAETGPAWSPDGSMIAFARTVECYYYCASDIFVMAADGANQRRLHTARVTYQRHTGPSWEPSGRWIAFSRELCGYYGCYETSTWMVEANGADLRKIMDTSAQPAWKP